MWVQWKAFGPKVRERKCIHAFTGDCTYLKIHQTLLWMWCEILSNEAKSKGVELSKGLSAGCCVPWYRVQCLLSVIHSQLHCDCMLMTCLISCWTTALCHISGAYCQKTKTMLRRCRHTAIHKCVHMPEVFVWHLCKDWFCGFHRQRERVYIHMYESSETCICLWQFNYPEVTLCGWRDVNIQLLTFPQGQC